MLETLSSTHILRHITFFAGSSEEKCLKPKVKSLSLLHWIKQSVKNNFAWLDLRVLARAHIIGFQNNLLLLNVIFCPRPLLRRLIWLNPCWDESESKRKFINDLWCFLMFLIEIGGGRRWVELRIKIDSRECPKLSSKLTDTSPCSDKVFSLNFFREERSKMSSINCLYIVLNLRQKKILLQIKIHLAQEVKKGFSMKKKTFRYSSLL